MRTWMKWCRIVDLFEPDFFNVAFFLRVIEMNIKEKTGIAWTSSMHPSRRLEYPTALSVLEKGSFRVKTDEVVLDAGGGATSFPFLLSKRCKEVHVTDISMDYMNMVKTIQGEFPEYGNMYPALEDILGMSYKDDFFDVSFCISVLEHHTCNVHVSEAVAELLRVTKGSLVVTMDVGCKAGENGPLSFRSLYELGDEYGFEVPERDLETFVQDVDGHKISIACIVFDKGGSE